MMPTTERFTKTFDLRNENSLCEYNAILNNPACTIIKEVREKITERHFDADGKIVATEERLLLVVSWQEKKLF